MGNDYMNIYQLPGQVHNIQLLALESLAFRQYVFLKFEVCFFKHFHISALVEDIKCPQRRISGIVILRY